MGYFIINLFLMSSFAAEMDLKLIKKSALQYKPSCDGVESITVEKISLEFKFDYDDKKSKPRKKIFYIATCPSGAYNSSSVLLSEDDNKVMMPIPFAIPLFSDENYKIKGWSSLISVGRLSYDAKKKQLTSFLKGRGLGDLSTIITYQFIEDRIALVKHEYDNTADEKMNPVIVYEVK